MTEIMKVYLYSKAPLTAEQEAEGLRDIGEQARAGFRVEIQREVLAHGAEETYTFLVRRIEPANKFYGSVDGDTVFEVMHDETKKPVPPPPQVDTENRALTTSEHIAVDEPLLLTEVDRLRPFIDELEAVRLKHNVSWGCLRKVVEAVDEFGGETAPRL